MSSDPITALILNMMISRRSATKDGSAHITRVRGPLAGLFLLVPLQVAQRRKQLPVTPVVPAPEILCVPLLLLLLCSCSSGCVGGVGSLGSGAAAAALIVVGACVG
jgi:hypothetical protein